MAVQSADELSQLCPRARGDGQTGGVGTALASPLVVEVKDQFGNVVSGFGVTFTASSGGGSVNPSASQNSGTDGRVSVTATLGSAVAQHQFTAAPTASGEERTAMPPRSGDIAPNRCKPVGALRLARPVPLRHPYQERQLPVNQPVKGRLRRAAPVRNVAPRQRAILHEPAMA